MALTNSQYDKIMRQYDRKQVLHRRELEQREAIVRKKIPRYAQIQSEIISAGVMKAKARLTGGTDFDLTAKIAALTAERSVLLYENGIPEDYLTMQYDCPICHDTGYINGREKCSCFKKAETELLYSQSQLGKILSSENFQAFCPDYYSDQLISPKTGRSSRETALLARDRALNFVRNFPSGENLFFYGDTGVGKTFLSHCIAKELLDRNFSVIYYSSHDFFELLSGHTFHREDSSEDLYQRLFTCDLLILDDLGTELSNSFSSSALFQVVNERLLSKKSTIISTNLSIDQFAVMYSERTFSRISSGYLCIMMFGNDIRIHKRLAELSGF